MAELKSCPFCGDEARHWFCSPDGKHISNVGGKAWGQECSHHIIRCKKCGIQTKVYATNKNCFNAWNRRFTVETNIYDKEETYPNCTVQVLTNTVTGDVSVGWWENGGNEDG